MRLYSPTALDQKLVNCEVRSYACVYSEGTPPDTPIHYDDSKGSFWQYHFYSKPCTTSLNHRWVSVCKLPCTATDIVSKNLQCCDLTKPLWYGKNSGAYGATYHSPCCPYDYSCLFRQSPCGLYSDLTSYSVVS